MKALLNLVLLTILALAMTSFQRAAYSQIDTPEDRPAGIRPQPDRDVAALLTKAARVYMKMKSYSHVETITADSNGNAPQSQTNSFALERPNRCRYVSEAGNIVVSDGRNLYDSWYQEYVNLPAPKNYASINQRTGLAINADFASATVLLMSQGSLLTLLRINKETDHSHIATILPDLQIGPPSVENGRKFDTMVTSSPDKLAETLYLDARTHLLIKWVIASNAPGPRRFSVTEALQNISIDQSAPAATFRFDPSPGAKYVERLKMPGVADPLARRVKDPPGYIRPQADRDVAKLLTRATRVYMNMKSYSHTEVNIGTSNGVADKPQSGPSFALQRPNRCQYRSNPLYSVVSDGEALYVHWIDEYVQRPAQKSFQQIDEWSGITTSANYIPATIMLMSQGAMLKLLRSNNAATNQSHFAMILPDLRMGAPAVENGRKFDTLVMSDPDLPIETLYFDARTHLLVKWVITSGGGRYSDTQALENIAINRPLPADTFHFDPPPGVKLVERFTLPKMDGDVMFGPDATGVPLPHSFRFPDDTDLFPPPFRFQ